MISIRKNRHGNFRLFIDGVELRHGVPNYLLGGRVANSSDLSLHVLDRGIVSQVASHRFSALPENLTSIYLDLNIPPIESADMSTRVHIEKNNQIFHISVDIGFVMDKWKRPWSITEYIEEAKRIVEKETKLELHWASPKTMLFKKSILLLLAPVSNTSTTIEETILSHASSIQRLHELTEASLISKLNDRGVAHIIRSIEFTPEYRQSGITILSYFADVLRHKNLSEQVKVSIEQSGLDVRLVIESPTGQRELIERTLETYALVVTGKQPIDTLTTDPYEVAELKSQLRLASAQIENKRELLALRTAEVTELRDEVKDTKASLKRMEQRAAEDRACLMSLMEGLVQHNTDLASGFRELAQEAMKFQNKRLAGALESLQRMVERGLREEDREEAIANLRIVQQENPGVFQRVYEGLVLGTVSGATGNYLYSWLQFVVGILPK